MEKEQGYIRKHFDLLISTEVGDNWKNKDFCNFEETKSGEIIIIDLRKDEKV